MSSFVPLNELYVPVLYLVYFENCILAYILIALRILLDKSFLFRKSCNLYVVTALLNLHVHVVLELYISEIIFIDFFFYYVTVISFTS